MSRDEQVAVLGKMVLERREIHTQNAALMDEIMRIAELAKSLAPLSAHGFGADALGDGMKTVSAIQQAGGIERLKSHIESLAANRERLARIDEAIG